MAIPGGHQTLKPRVHSITYKLSLWDDHSVLQFTLQSQLDNFVLTFTLWFLYPAQWDFPWKIVVITYYETQRERQYEVINL